MSLRESILSGLKLPFEDVTIQLETGPAVIRVQALNGARMMAYRKLMKDRGGEEDGDDAGWFQMCFGCVDPATGELLFSPDDVGVLKEKMTLADAQTIIETSNRVNGLSRDVGKPSATTPTTGAV